MNKPEFALSMLHPRYWLLWLALGLFALSTWLPFAMQLALGRGIGKLLSIFAKSRKNVARINLQWCMPQLTEAQREQLLEENMLAMGIGLIEQNIGWFMSHRRLRKLIEVEGLEHIQALEGQGAIIVTRHTSSVQLAVVAVTMFTPAAGMYRRHKNAVLDYVQRKCRERMDPRCEAFERGEVRTMLKLLRKGTQVLYAPDQDYGIKQGVWAKFFGVTAATVTATSRFAKMGKAKVIPMDFVRKPGSKGYLLSFYPALENFPSDSELDDVQRVNDTMEAMVRKTPEQYFWVHRRFKNRPEGETPPY